MKLIRLLYLVVLAQYALFGCATSDESEFIDPQGNAIIPPVEETDFRDYSVFSPYQHAKSLSDYAQQIAMELKIRERFEKPIAVASYVEFDETLTNSNRLGNQLAEALLIEMNQMGYPVADINATGALQINQSGSFAFSRTPQAVTESLCCVLSGNLIYEPRGVRVNSKLFEVQTKRVIAASSLVIPYFIAEQYGVVVPR